MFRLGVSRAWGFRSSEFRVQGLRVHGDKAWGICVYDLSIRIFSWICYISGTAMLKRRNLYKLESPSTLKIPSPLR